LKIELINPIDSPGWDHLLRTTDNASFFHSSAWARVLSETYGYKPVYGAIPDNGKLTGFLPVMEIKSLLTGKRGVSLPFTDTCEPVAEDQRTFEALLEGAAAYGREAGWRHLELRGGDAFLNHAPASAKHLGHTLQLSSNEDEVSARFKPNIRRNIRKAEKAGVNVVIERSLESLDFFYRMHCGTRRFHGLPPQPWSFFQNIHRHVIAAGNGFVALAWHQKRCIAGAVYARWRDQAIYKYGASDRSWQHLRPNNLVMWEAIRWCCRNGIRIFCFGRTEPDNEGLAHFKRSWGSAEKSIRYFKFDLNANIFVSPVVRSKSSYGVFRHMPESVLRMVGTILYRHVG
jgi:CelD/BcsL family acetyltransferase involved in cellulose biosynthesis